MASLTIVSWNTDANGVWTAADDWLGGVPDTTSIEAILGAKANPYTVTSSADETLGGLEVDAGVTLDITAGVFTTYDTVATSANTILGGTIEIGAGATLGIGQVGSPGDDSAEISGYGALDIQGGTLDLAAPRLAIVGASLVLSNGGKIAATNAKAELENVSGVIYGSGSIGAATPFQLQNDIRGAIEATGLAGSALTINTGSTAVYNAGLIASDGAGGLVIEGQLDNSGELLAAVGAITLDDCLVTDVGTIVVFSGAVLSLHNGIIAGQGPLDIGAATSVGGMVSTTVGDMTVTGIKGPPNGDALSSDCFNYGVLDVLDDSVLNDNALIDNMNAGSIVNLMASGSGVAELVVYGGAATVTGGTIAMSNCAGNKILSNGVGEQFNDSALIAGSGVIGDGYLRLFVAQNGIVDADGSTALKILGVSKGTELPDFNAGLIEATGAGRLAILGALDNSGTLSAVSAGGITLNGAQITTGGGTISVAATGTLTLTNGSRIANQGQITVAAGGVIATLAGAAADAIESNVFNSGTLNVNAGSTLLAAAHVFSTATGQILVGAAKGAAATVEVAAGQSWNLSGSGVVKLFAGAKIIGAGAGAQFWDAGLTIKGAGQIGDGAMQIYVTNGGVIDATGALTLDSGASLALSNGGTLEAVKGGALTIENAIFSSGYIIADGGAVVAKGAISKPGLCEVEAGGTLELGGQDGNQLTFGAGGGTVQLDAAGGVTGTIWGLSADDTLDLRGLSFVAGKMALGANSNFGTLDGQLYVTNGTATSQDFWLQGNYTASNLASEKLSWTFTSDGHGGTNVTL